MQLLLEISVFTSDISSLGSDAGAGASPVRRFERTNQSAAEVK